MNKNKISINSRILLLASGLLLCISIFVPTWRIELDAPQYPEGLMLLIYPNKLGGNVDIINGLNHYIGMETLHAEKFIEFTLLPYIIGFYALLVFVTAIIARKKMVTFSFSAFVFFGIVAMVDFWRWEYNYGHNLNPNAAIIVPGMAYQPPLIGFKQLLNFGAYSVPDIGGWLFIISGLLMLIAVLNEKNVLNKRMKKKSTTTMLMLSLLFMACSNMKSELIQLNKDSCSFCKMTIADGRFGAELITKKGRIYKFDDLGCMLQYKKENNKTGYQSFFVNDFAAENILIPVETAHYVYSEKIKSPMNGRTAAFALKETADAFAKELNAEVNTWEKISE